MRQIFRRGAFDDLWLTIRSDQQLGILDTGFVEDEHGVDWQVTLYHVATAARFDVVLAPVFEYTPATPDDVFRGYVELDAMPGGRYEIRGQVRDLAGNRTILSTVDSAPPAARVIPFWLDILEGESQPVELGPLFFQGGVRIILPATNPLIDITASTARIAELNASPDTIQIEVKSSPTIRLFPNDDAIEVLDGNSTKLIRFPDNL